MSFLLTTQLRKYFSGERDYSGSYFYLFLEKGFEIPVERLVDDSTDDLIRVP